MSRKKGSVYAGDSHSYSSGGRHDDDYYGHHFTGAGGDGSGDEYYHYTNTHALTPHSRRRPEDVLIIVGFALLFTLAAFLLSCICLTCKAKNERTRTNNRGRNASVEQARPQASPDRQLVPLQSADVPPEPNLPDLDHLQPSAPLVVLSFVDGDDDVARSRSQNPGEPSAPSVGFSIENERNKPLYEDLPPSYDEAVGIGVPDMKVPSYKDAMSSSQGNTSNNQ